VRDEILEKVFKGSSEQHAMRLKLVTPMEVWVQSLRGRLDNEHRTVYEQAHTTQLRTRGSFTRGAASAIADFTRVKMKEEGFWRKIMPPTPIGKSTTMAQTTVKQAYRSTPNVNGDVFGLDIWDYSALGVLCDLYLRFERQHRGDASWRGNEFQWLVKGKLRRSNSCKKVPTPVRMWWERHHGELPFRNLKAYLRNPYLKFEQFADLLEMHGPWT